MTESLKWHLIVDKYCDLRRTTLDNRKWFGLQIMKKKWIYIYLIFIEALEDFLIDSHCLFKSYLFIFLNNLSDYF